MTATMAAPKRRRGKAADEPTNGNGDPRFSIPVKFKNVNIGDTTGSVGISVDRQHLSIEKAEEVLCGHRLVGRAVRLQDGEHQDQQRFDAPHHQIAGAFDVKKFSVSPKTIDATLAFALNDIEISELGFLAKQSGRVLVDDIQAIAKVAELEDDEEQESLEFPEDDDETPPPKKSRKKVERPADFVWRSTPVGMLGLSPAIFKRLEKANLATIGLLADYIKGGSPLEAVVGKANENKVAEKLIAWLRENNVDPEVIDPDA